MATLDELLEAFLAWRAKVAVICGQPVPHDLIPLLAEQAQLEPLRWQAGEWRSRAVQTYYKSKATTMDALWTEVAKTALHEIAKARAYKSLGFRELATETLEAITSRQFTVRAEIKRLGVAP